MNSSPYFSIIIPTYNRAYFLDMLVKSLLDQTFPDFEILIIDDGSTDGTDETVKKFSDNRIRYYYISNSERGAARNYGTTLSSGKYLNFFDSDDIAYQNHLQVAFRESKRLMEPEIFHLAYDIKDPPGNLIRKVDSLPSMINNRLIDGNHLSCNGVFLRKDIAEQYSFNESRDLSGSEDYDLWLKLAARYPIYCINEITSTVINHEARSVLQTNSDKLLIRFKVLQDSLNGDEAFLFAYGKKINIFKAYINLYIALHLGLAKNNKLTSLRYILIACYTHPGVLFSRRFLGALKRIFI